MIDGDRMLIIEKVNGGVRIKYGTAVERYIGYSLRNAEIRFREEYGLKGKRLIRICI